jgi:hypothetical protein
MKEEEIDWRSPISGLPVPAADRFPSQDRVKCTANDQIETYDLLSQDRKFVHALKSIESDFKKGYQMIVDRK